MKIFILFSNASVEKKICQNNLCNVKSKYGQLPILPSSDGSEF